MEEPASAVYSAISASVRQDAEERLIELSIQQASGQITKQQKQHADKLREQLKTQASDILESKDGDGDIDKLKQIFSKGN